MRHEMFSVVSLYHFVLLTEPEHNHVTSTFQRFDASEVRKMDAGLICDRKRREKYEYLFI